MNKILKAKYLLVRGKARLSCLPQTRNMNFIISGEFNKGGSLHVKKWRHWVKRNSYSSLT